jgi:hypothetical protein
MISFSHVLQTAQAEGNTRPDTLPFLIFPGHASAADYRFRTANTCGLSTVFSSFTILILQLIIIMSLQPLSVPATLLRNCQPRNPCRSGTYCTHVLMARLSTRCTHPRTLHVSAFVTNCMYTLVKQATGDLCEVQQDTCSSYTAHVLQSLT